MVRRGPTCPTCGHALKTRVGVELSEQQGAIFDAIQRAGPDGITPRDLHDSIYGDRSVQRTAISTHVAHINDRLASTDHRIKGGQGKYSTYRLVRVRVRAVA